VAQLAAGLDNVTLGNTRATEGGVAQLASGLDGVRIANARTEGAEGFDLTNSAATASSITGTSANTSGADAASSGAASGDANASGSPATNGNGTATTATTNQGAATEMKLSGDQTYSSVASRPVWQPPPRSEILRNLPSLKSVPAAELQKLFIKKLHLACIIFDWTDPSLRESEASGRNAKTAILRDLVEFLDASQTDILNEVTVPDVVRMFAMNVFRTIYHRDQEPEPTTAGGENEEENQPKEPAWEHMSLVYEFFLRFLVSCRIEGRVLKKYINGPFVQRLLELFDSLDTDERDYVKTLLHRIYAKFMSLRSLIRKWFNNIFHTFIYEAEKFHGAAEILEILGSIINGFALPLKSEHKSFFTRVLIPLHKVRSLATFHQQLTYCIAQFVEKDSTLAVPWIHGLVRYWPNTNSPKEVLFLQEVEEVLEYVKAAEVAQIAPIVFRQVAKCICSPHFQVTERAFIMFQVEHVLHAIQAHRADVFPVIVPAMHRNRSHWNPTVAALSSNVLALLREYDSDLVGSCLYAAEAEEAKVPVHEENAPKWALLEQEYGPVLASMGIPTAENERYMRDAADCLPPNA